MLSWIYKIFSYFSLTHHFLLPRENEVGRCGRPKALFFFPRKKCLYSSTLPLPEGKSLWLSGRSMGYKSRGPCAGLAPTKFLREFWLIPKLLGVSGFWGDCLSPVLLDSMLFSLNFSPTFHTQRWSLHHHRLGAICHGPSTSVSGLFP